MSRVSGYYAQEINENIFNGKLLQVEDLRKYQQTKPESNLFDVVNILATDNPQHPPIYYLLLRLWRKIFGQSIISARSLSALFSVLIFPCIYWLCKELEQSSRLGWIAIAIIAVSPIHVLYAQEAREYSLWTLTTLISSIALLRAIKYQKTVNWSIYALISSIGLYVFPFSLFINLGHIIYIAIYSFYLLIKKNDRNIWLFMVVLSSSVFVFLASADLLLGLLLSPSIINCFCRRG